MPEETSSEETPVSEAPVAETIATEVLSSAENADVPLPAGSRFRSVAEWDYRQSSGFSAERIAEFVRFHQALARGLARSLSVYVRIPIEFEISKAQDVSSEEIESTLVADAFYATIQLKSQPLPVIIQLESSIVTPLLDVLLGGTGEKPCARTELSDIDTRILSDLSLIVARELEIAWEKVGIECLPDIHVGRAALKALPPASRVFALAMIVKLTGVNGAFNILLPPSIADAIFSTLESRVQEQARAAGNSIGERSADRLANLAIGAELVLPTVQVAIRDLANLAPGSVLRLPIAAHNAGSFVVEGKELFIASPVKSGDLRAARLEASPTNTDDNDEDRHHHGR